MITLSILQSVETCQVIHDELEQTLKVKKIKLQISIA